jgi:Raf kinase inhibitor-like YbhB/YbcL family protein
VKRLPAYFLLSTLTLAIVLAGCGDDPKKDDLGEPAPTAPEQIRLTSPFFGKNDTIPTRFTCDGEEVSPQLDWSDVPADAEELALLVTDPDAPGGDFVHWTVYGIHPLAKNLNENGLIKGAREGENSAGKQGYAGPCPPEGDDPHRYVFALYALEAKSGLASGASPAEVRAALDRSAIARGQLIVKYGR